MSFFRLWLVTQLIKKNNIKVERDYLVKLEKEKKQSVAKIVKNSR